MITFIANNGFAVVQTIEDRIYTIARYNDEQEWRQCKAPLEVYSMIGTPNSIDILNILPNGFIYNGNENLPTKSTPPKSVTALQIRKWLLSQNITMDTIYNLINEIEDQTLKSYTLIEWEYAPYIERNHSMINTIGSLLGLSEEQIDDGFIAAEKL